MREESNKRRPFFIIGSSLFMHIAVALILLSFTSCKKNISCIDARKQKLHILLDSARDILFTETPKAKTLLGLVMKETKDSMTYYEAYEAYATTLLLVNRYDSGIAMKQKSELFFLKQPNSSRKRELLSSINDSYGVHYSLINKPDSSIIYLNKALQYHPEQSEMPNIYINLADAYKTMGNLPTAALYLRKALKTSDSLNLREYKFPLYYGLGDIYLGLRDFKQANEYYLHAEANYRTRRFDEKVNFCNSRGNYYYYKQEYTNALIWFKRAENYLSNTKYDYYKNLVFTNLSDVYLNLHKFDSCKYYLNQAEPYFKSINHQSALYYLNTIRMGLAIAQTKIALAYQIKRQIESNENITPDIISIRLKFLEKLSLKEGNYKDAYSYLKQNTILSDSLRDDRTQKRIAELDMRYKQDSSLMKKNLIIQQQKAEVRTFKLSTCIWILISILSLLGAILGYHIIKKRLIYKRTNILSKS